MIYEVICIMDVYATSPDQAAKAMVRLMTENKVPIVKVKEPKSGYEAVYDTSVEPPKKVVAA